MYRNENVMHQKHVESEHQHIEVERHGCLNPQKTCVPRKLLDWFDDGGLIQHISKIQTENLLKMLPKFGKPGSIQNLENFGPLQNIGHFLVHLNIWNIFGLPEILGHVWDNNQILDVFGSTPPPLFWTLLGQRSIL